MRNADVPYYQRTESQNELNRKRKLVRYHAMRQLARMHPHDFKRIYARKCVEHNLPVPAEITL